MTLSHKLGLGTAGLLVAAMVATAPVSAEVTIGFAPSVWDPSDFHGMMMSGMEEVLIDTGIEYKLLVRAPANAVAHEEQLAIVENLIAEGVDYIIINPTDPLVQRVAYKKVIDSGIPLIVGNYSNPFPDDWGFQPMMMSGYRHEDAGATMANYVRDKHGEGTQIAIIHGSPGWMTEARAPKALYESLGMEIVYEDYADFDRMKAYDVMERILAAYPDVDVIVTASSSMASGAVEATVANNVGGKYPIYGAGGLLDELRYIEDGLLAGAWIRDPIENGRAAGNAIRMHIEGKQSEIAPIFNSPIHMIDSIDAINEFVNPITYTSKGLEFPRLPKN